MQVDWMTLTYLVIGFFALSGFLRGWWKEAFTTIVLAFLLILLQLPDFAEWTIDILNRIVTTIWEFLSGLLPLLSTTSTPQISASSSGTWLVILVLLVGAAILLARSSLPGSIANTPGKFYAVGPIARLLGILVGAMNGFLLLNLVREYLDGRSLPGRGPDTEAAITLTRSSSFGPPSSDLVIQAVELPRFTILDSFVPWLVIGIGILILIAVLRNRVGIVRSTKGAGTKVEYRPPYGYRSVDV